MVPRQNQPDDGKKGAAGGSRLTKMRGEEEIIKRLKIRGLAPRCKKCSRYFPFDRRVLLDHKEQGCRSPLPRSKSSPIIVLNNGLSINSGGQSLERSISIPMTEPRKVMLDVEAPEELKKGPLRVPQRVLTGPGPSNCSERVLRALYHQSVGHMHPEMFQIMDEIKAGLRYAFQTRNKLTLAVSASGHSGMEASIGNLLERGERILVAKSGHWGARAGDIANRLGIHVDFLETKLGVAFSLNELEEAIKKHKPAAVFVTHSESSTGMKQPLEGVGDIVHKYGALLIVDTVASLGAEPFFADSWSVDVVYTGSQKVLGAPAGLTPISFSPLAERKILSRKTPIPVYYWDMTLLGRYWNCFGDGSPRIYHHTVSSTLICGLREALAQLAEEGLAASWSRHAAVTEKFRRGVVERNLGEFFVPDPRHRLNAVTAVKVQPDVDYVKVLRNAMDRYNVEISGGLGPTDGKVIRIGFLGVNATSGHVDLVLRALDEAIKIVKGRGLESNL